jgi:leader peptidase (prepilin peptidase)/N-methyltransferase
MAIAFLILLFILGACFGSFLCCQARRLHLKASRHKTLGPRSICLKCQKQLKWYDNLPIISWLILKGKCRFCQTPIGAAELLSELGMAISFTLIGTTFDFATANVFSWAMFVLILIFILIIGFLAIYDGLYGELPVGALIAALICSTVILILKECETIFTTAFTSALIWQPLLSVVILGGLYLLLYLISKGKWVGDGDWLLGTALGMVLFHPFLALITLFLANLLACLVMAPTVVKKQNHQIYFGPFLVIAFVVAYAFANFFQSML